MARAPKTASTTPFRSTAPARVLGYCRVSSEAQEEHGTSLEGQQETLRQRCQERGWPEPELFVEVESGGEYARERRVEQVRLESVAREGDAIMVCLADRWSRDVVYTLASVRELTRRGVRWLATEDGIDALPPPGDIPTALIDRAADAEKERARIRKRTVGTRQRLRAQGFHVEGHPPLGYKVAKRKLVIDEQRAPIVRRMFALAADGCSVREIESVLVAEFPGVPGIVGNINRQLRDRRYRGESCTAGHGRGEWIATHEAIVDARTWARTQAGLDARKVGGRKPSEEARTAKHLLRGGLLFCAHCGRPMLSWAPMPPEDITHGGYYFCRKPKGDVAQQSSTRCNRGPSARATAVDELVLEAVEARLVDLADRLSKPPKRSTSPKPARRGEVERTKLVAKLARLVDAVAEGVMSHATAKSKIAEVEAAIRRLDDAAVAEEPPPPVDRVELLGHVQAMRRAWAHLDLEDRRDAIRRLAEKIEIKSTATKKWQRGAWKLQITWIPLEHAVAKPT